MVCSGEASARHLVLRAWSILVRDKTWCCPEFLLSPKSVCWVLRWFLGPESCPLDGSIHKRTKQQHEVRFHLMIGATEPSPRPTTTTENSCFYQTCEKKESSPHGVRHPHPSWTPQEENQKACDGPWGWFQVEKPEVAQGENKEKENKEKENKAWSLPADSICIIKPCRLKKTELSCSDWFHI